MTKRRFWRNDGIEDVTTQRIHEYEAKAGVSVTLPVPIEQVVEQVLGLDFVSSQPLSAHGETQEWNLPANVANDRESPS